LSRDTLSSSSAFRRHCVTFLSHIEISGNDMEKLSTDALVQYFHLTTMVMQVTVGNQDNINILSCCRYIGCWAARSASFKSCLQTFSNYFIAHFMFCKSEIYFSVSFVVYEQIEPKQIESFCVVFSVCSHLLLRLCPGDAISDCPSPQR